MKPKNVFVKMLSKEISTNGLLARSDQSAWTYTYTLQIIFQNGAMLLVEAFTNFWSRDGGSSHKTE